MLSYEIFSNNDTVCAQYNPSYGGICPPDVDTCYPNGVCNPDVNDCGPDFDVPCLPECHPDENGSYFCNPIEDE